MCGERPVGGARGARECSLVPPFVAGRRIAFGEAYVLASSGGRRSTSNRQHRQAQPALGLGGRWWIPSWCCSRGAIMERDQMVVVLGIVGGV